MCHISVSVECNARRNIPSTRVWMCVRVCVNASDRFLDNCIVAKIVECETC